MNYKAEVKSFVSTNLLFGAPGDIQDDTSFLDTGTVDSTGIFEIIMFLENTYNIKIEAEETIPDNLDSINRISDYLTRKLSPPAKP